MPASPRPPPVRPPASRRLKRQTHGTSARVAVVPRRSRRPLPLPTCKDSLSTSPHARWPAFPPAAQARPQYRWLLPPLPQQQPSTPPPTGRFGGEGARGMRQQAVVGKQRWGGSQRQQRRRRGRRRCGHSGHAREPKRHGKTGGRDGQGGERRRRRGTRGGGHVPPPGHTRLPAPRARTVCRGGVAVYGGVSHATCCGGVAVDGGVAHATPTCVLLSSAIFTNMLLQAGKFCGLLRSSSFSCYIYSTRVCVARAPIHCASLHLGALQQHLDHCIPFPFLCRFSPEASRHGLPMSTLPLFTPHACRRHCRLPSPDIGAARCVARGPPRLLAAPSAASVGERPPPPSCGVPPTTPPPSPSAASAF